MLEYCTIALKKLDLIAGIVILILGLISIRLYFFSETIYLFMIGLSVVLASLVYLIKYKSFILGGIISDRIDVRNLGNNFNFLLCDILFFFFFSASLLLLHNSDDGRPLLYFILISICAGLIALSINYTQSKLIQIYHILKILLLSLNIKCSIFYLYAGFSMPDVWRHVVMMNTFLQTVNLTALWNKEQCFPIMHISTAVTKILTNSDIKFAFGILMVIFIISSVCVYLFARKYFGEKVGLLALLIVNITDYHTLWGSSPQTTTFGLILFYFLIYILLNTIENRNNKKWFALSLVFIVELILSHIVSSFIFLISLVGLLFGSLIYRMLYDIKENVYFVTIFIFTSISLFFYWFMALFRSNPVFDTLVYNLFSAIASSAAFLNRPESIDEYVMSLPPFIERAADILGLSILIFLSVLGALFLLSPTQQNKLHFSIISCVTLIFGITFGFPLFGLRNIIPDRWFVFGYFFVSILAALSILMLINIFRHGFTIKLIIMGIIVALSFSMIASTVSNTDSPIWLSESTISNTYSLSEMVAASTITKYCDNTYSDPRYNAYVLKMYFTSLRDESHYDYVLDLNSSIFNDCQDNNLYVWRKYTLDRAVTVNRELIGDYSSLHFKLRTKNYIFGFKFLNKLEICCNKIYNNGDVAAFGYAKSGMTY